MKNMLNKELLNTYNIFFIKSDKLERTLNILKKYVEKFFSIKLTVYQENVFFIFPNKNNIIEFQSLLDLKKFYYYNYNISNVQVIIVYDACQIDNIYTNIINEILNSVIFYKYLFFIFRSNEKIKFISNNNIMYIEDCVIQQDLMKDKYIKILLNNISDITKLLLIKHFDNNFDLFVKFLLYIQNIILKFCKLKLQIKCELNCLEKTLFMQVHNKSIISLIRKYQHCSCIINLHQKHDLDIVSEMLLLINIFN